MCLAKTYLATGGERELVLEDVALVEVEDGTLRLSNIFGEEKVIRGVIHSVDFQTGSVVVAAVGEAPAAPAGSRSGD